MLTLAKKEGDWQVVESTEAVPADFKLETAMVEGRLRALAGAKAVEMLAGAAGTEPGFGQAIISASLVGGETITLSIGRKLKREKDELRLVQGNADDQHYLMPQKIVDRLLGMLPSFKRPAMPTQPGRGMPGQIDPKMLEKLPPEVRAKLLQQLGQRWGFADPPHRSGYQVTSKSRDQRRFSDSERITQANSERG